MTYYQNLQIKENRENESGFILLTVPIFLVLFSFFVTAMVNEIKPEQFYFETITQDKMSEVKTTLALYAHRNYRVPCPADPSAIASVLGTETGLNADNKCAVTKGILPFRALGLTEEAAKDEWGNYYTYKVSPDFTKQFSSADLEPVGDGAEKLLIAPSDNSEFFVHELCRTPGWMNSGQNDYVMTDGTTATLATQDVNQNTYKAHFCCPSNVSGAGETEFTAAEYKDKAGGKTVTFGDDEFVMSIEALDSDIVLWDESAILYYDWKGNPVTRADLISKSAVDAPNANFYYNPEFTGKLGDGLGSDDHGGKFWKNSAVYTFDTDKVKARTMTFDMSDLGCNNWYDPVQVSIDVVDGSGTLIDTITMISQFPEAASGVGELVVSLDTIMGDPDQKGLFYPGVRDGRLEGNKNCGSPYASFAAYRNGAAERPISAAVDVFNASKASLTAKLASAGLTIEDVSIGKLKMNASHVSMAFSKIAYGSPGIATNTDIKIRNEAGDERITRGENEDAYEAANLMHNAAVTQDFEAPAYALISHGENGEGAYLVNLTNDQIDNIADGLENTAEFENHSHNQEVHDVRKISSVVLSEQFDDIVVWDSQITLYNSLRNGTCEASQSL